MGRKKSGYLQRKEAESRIEQKATYIAVRSTYLQFMADTASITLNNFGWGTERIDNFLIEWGKVYDMFLEALTTNPEADYLRDKLDERVKQICKPEFYKPFDERYKYVEEMRY